MPTRVRSYSKINLGLAIGPVRPDGFHGLATLYQTLGLHDWVTVEATCAPGLGSQITMTTNHEGVPTDGRNTAWKMVEGALERMGVSGHVKIDIEKRLPVQGGMGAGSANAAAALIGLERELGRSLPDAERLEVAAGVGSDVPLFLVGGAVMGTGRGEVVRGMRDFAPTPCVVAVPEVGVSTPLAFRDWDRKYAARRPEEERLTAAPETFTLEQLSRLYSSVLGDWNPCHDTDAAPHTSGIVGGSGSETSETGLRGQAEYSGAPFEGELEEGLRNDLAEDALLALVRTGIENDFEEVVFPQYPLLREIKRELMGVDSGAPATYAALSGSGSALFGLYRSQADAEAAQRRVQASGCKAFLTETLPRSEYWRKMFAE